MVEFVMARANHQPLVRVKLSWGWRRASTDPNTDAPAPGASLRSPPPLAKASAPSRAGKLARVHVAKEIEVFVLPIVTRSSKIAVPASTNRSGSARFG